MANLTPVPSPSDQGLNDPNWIRWFTSIFTTLTAQRTWLDVSGTRAFGSPYPNTSGKEMPITISLTAGGTAPNVQLSINTVVVLNSDLPINQKTTIFHIVPIGSSYQLTVTNSPTVTIWKELT